MRILLIAGAFNSLTQRVYAELADHGHHMSVECHAATHRSRPSAAMTPT